MWCILYCNNIIWKMQFKEAKEPNMQVLDGGMELEYRVQLGFKPRTFHWVLPSHHRASSHIQLIMK